MLTYPKTLHSPEIAYSTGNSLLLNSAEWIYCKLVESCQNVSDKTGYSQRYMVPSAKEV